MKKVSILALHLGYGGIERFICNLANSLSDLYDVTVVSTYDLASTSFFQLNDKVKVVYLKKGLKPNKKDFLTSLKKFKLFKAFKEGIKALKILYLRKKLMVDYLKNSSSDIYISTRAIHNKWLGKYGNQNAFKIASEHNYHNNNARYIKKIVKSVKKVSAFVLVSSELRDFYQSKVDIPCYYIPNTITKLNKQSSLKAKAFVSVGRLERVKAFADLIITLEPILKENSDWQLKIVGDGSEYANLKKLIRDKHLEGNVFLLGYKNETELNKILLESAIYVMASLSESFGLVFVEAMATGLPIVSFANSGAKEIIKKDTGFIVENRDQEEFRKYVLMLMNDESKRKAMGSNSYLEAKKYLASNVLESWVNLFEKK